jgi:hypothetical protein
MMMNKASVVHICQKTCRQNRLKTSVLRTVLAQNGSKCKVCHKVTGFMADII